MSDRVEPVDIAHLPHVGAAAVCMGAFDGVHRGHVALAEVTVRAARQRNVRSVALVFDPHPDEVVRPGVVVPRLAPMTENLRQLAAAGIEHPIVVRFDAALRALDPAAFLAAMAPSIELRALVMTPESAFGRNRSGTPDAMRIVGSRMGFDLVMADQIVLDGERPISSARVREALAGADIAEAARLLGHPVHLEAEVVSASDGSGIIRFGYAAALPPSGRYPVDVRLVEPPGASRAGQLVIEDGGDVRLEIRN